MAVVGKCRVLIVEDDIHTRAALQNMLKLLGHEACGASTAAEALKLLRAQKFDAVLLDLVLPDESGVTVLEAIRRLEMRVKVAVVTALRNRPPELGDFKPDAFFNKPVDAFELAAWVGSCGE